MVQGVYFRSNQAYQTDLRLNEGNADPMTFCWGKNHCRDCWEVTIIWWSTWYEHYLALIQVLFKGRVDNELSFRVDFDLLRRQDVVHIFRLQPIFVELLEFLLVYLLGFAHLQNSE